MSHVRQILAFLIIQAVLAVAAPAGGQILFRSIGLDQPSPLQIEEGYEAGWDLQLTVSFTIPVGAEPFELWLRAYSPAHLQYKASIGYSATGNCGFEVDRLPPPGEDWLIADNDWRSSPDGGLIAGSRFEADKGAPDADPPVPARDIDVDFVFALRHGVRRRPDRAP